MALQFICNTPNAAPCTYDSRFNSDLADGTVKGKIKRQHRHVKRGDVLPWVGFESRRAFDPGNKETEVQNEEDRKMLIEKLIDMGIDVKGDEPLHQLGKSYNFYDPRLDHTRYKHGYAVKKVPILGRKKGGTQSSSPDEAEIKEIKAFLDEHNVEYHAQLGLKKLRVLKEETEEELTSS
jgi:hypothetical protein